MQDEPRYEIRGMSIAPDGAFAIWRIDVAIPATVAGIAVYQHAELEVRTEFHESDTMQEAVARAHRAAADLAARVQSLLESAPPSELRRRTGNRHAAATSFGRSED